MDFLEKDLEDIIFNSDRDALCQRGLHIAGKMLRQVRIGTYGIADLISWHRMDGKLYITIFELKRKDLNTDTIIQALRYKRGVESYLRNFRSYDHSKAIIEVVLIGRSVKGEGFKYLIGNLKRFYAYTYYYNERGINFDEVERFYTPKEEEY